MSVSNTSIVAADPTAELGVDCYVRSTVPGPIAETIDTVVERLQTLCERDRIAEYDVNLWPPEQDAIADSIEGRTSTRNELVAEFERWADRHGYSLEPAFRRETTSALPFGRAISDTYERVRVPVVALAIRDLAATDSLCGVVPCTESLPTEMRTYTVDEWLSAMESSDERYPDSAGGATPIEGQQ